MIEQSVDDVADAMTEDPQLWASMYLDLKKDNDNHAAILERALWDMLILCIVPAAGEC